jgi:acetyl esterase
VSRLSRRLTRVASAALLRWPRPLTTLLRPPPPARAAGLDPQLAAVLTLQHRLGLPGLETLDLRGARRLSDEGLAPLDAHPRALAEVRDVREAGAPLMRLYRPARRGPGLVVYFHGGGGVVGSIDSHDPWCRALAHHAEVQVLSVEYRLAPEHPHPAAIEDAIAAWRWASANAASLGATRLACGGDSFGGYLCAVLDQATSRPELHAPSLPSAAGLPAPALQILIYPLVDLTLSSPSIEGNGQGYLLTAAMMKWFRAHYWGDAKDDGARRDASPLFTEMPRAADAIVMLAGFDPLLDEGRAYAKRLAESGAEVKILEHSALIHGFVVMTGAIRAARAACLELCEHVRAKLTE